MTGKYYMAKDWSLKRTQEGEPLLENTSGGQILLDETVNEMLEAVNGKDRGHLETRKTVSTQLVDTFLKVFIQVGVIKEEGGSNDEAADNKVPHLPGTLEENPLVSIVIINYNGDSHLPDLLSSLDRQVYKNLELIVVDNCSHDNSCQWIKSNHPGVIIMELKKNIGFASAVNAGILKAQGDYVLVLNNDIALDEHAVYYLVEKALSIEGQWSAIAPKMKFFNNRAFINAIGNSLYPITWGSDNFIGQVDLGQFDNFDRTFSACFGAVLLNAAAIKEIGLLECRYRFYYEDMDWSFRAQALGYPIYTAPKSEIYHKFGASMSQKSQAFKTRFIVGNRLFFTLKNLEFITIKRYFLNYLIEDIKSMLIYLKRKNLSMFLAYVRSYLRFSFSLPSLFFKRRKLQKKRVAADGSILANVAPLNLTVMDKGLPKLDIFSLRTNYTFNGSEASADEIMLQRRRPPRKDRNSAEKIYMEYSFHLQEGGYYDIHLLGLMKRNYIVYLDNRPVNPEAAGTTNSNRFEMNATAVKNLYIPAGRHSLDVERRSHVETILLRKVK